MNTQVIGNASVTSVGEVRQRPLSYTLAQKYWFARQQRDGNTVVIVRRADGHEVRILRIAQ
jgi:hypothetical protein